MVKTIKPKNAWWVFEKKSSKECSWLRFPANYHACANPSVPKDSPCSEKICPLSSPEDLAYRRWIDADCPPEKECACLVWAFFEVGGWGSGEVYFDGNSFRFVNDYGDYQKLDKVVSWMPMPEKPC